MRLPATIPFLIGWSAGLATAALVAAAVGIYMLLGGFDTGAVSQHGKLVAWVLHRTMRDSVKVRARDVRAPSTNSRATVLAGARFYASHCVACHGGPAVARAQWASAIIPTPPYLLGAARRWTDPELFTIIHDGVKMTGMPAWGEVASDRDIWNVVAFLDALPTASLRADQQLHSIIDAAAAQPPQHIAVQASQSSAAGTSMEVRRR
jgi:mono/diheme cytochrome c family protein